MVGRVDKRLVIFRRLSLQGSFDAMLAATPELTADLISEFIEAINYTPFSMMTLDGDSVTFDGVTCSLRIRGTVPGRLRAV